MAGTSNVSFSRKIKDEPIDPVDLEARIIELCSQYVDGLPDSELQLSTPNIDALQRAAVINSLLTKDKISLLKSSNGRPIYKLKNPEALLKIQGADREEKVVYQIIELSGNKGIWIRDIRTHSNLPQAQLAKILRTLETKKLIKSVKSVGAVRKKVYMLFELEPDASLVGGTFYSDQEFDVEFANLLSLQCSRFLQAKGQFAAEKYADDFQKRYNASYVASTEVLEHIRQLKISNVELKLMDIEAILNTLVWDAKAERSHRSNGTTFYRYAKPILPMAGLVKMPCGHCPVFSDCRPGGVISPANCQYFKSWLDLLD